MKREPPAVRSDGRKPLARIPLASRTVTTMGMPSWRSSTHPQGSSPELVRSFVCNMTKTRPVPDPGRARNELRITAEVRGPVREAYLQQHEGHALGMFLRPGFMEFGPKRSALERTWFETGELGFCTPHSEQWIGTADMEHLVVGISDVALATACDGACGSVELRSNWKMRDSRLGSLLAAVNAERVAGFPNGRLFLDSVEQAIAVVLVKGYAARGQREGTHRGGLGPARLRRVTELVQAKMHDDLSLFDLAQSTGLSSAH